MTEKTCEYCVVFHNGVNVCLHQNVRARRGIVNQEVCRRCTQRFVPCEPKPIPTEIPVPSTPPKIKMPGIVSRGWKYARALAKWVFAGSPTRTQKEIDSLLAICDVCPYFNHEFRACGLCGCNVNKQAEALTNKLAMATEDCPDGRWAKVLKIQNQ